MTDTASNPKTRRSLSALLGELPSQIGDLVRAELAAFKAELTEKLKGLGIGAAMFAAAALFLFFAGCVFIATAIIALALVLPLWLSALIIAVVLLIIAVVLALVGLKKVKAATATDSNGVRASIREDIDALKGVGEYEH
ncbi:phage holin family protein [Cryobacterium tepidiphilum]|uniref:Phage holin family protein n=1 Tax=Cryobacterium tepidiphilum TaxID=2486026 RepID=A0A3M8LQ83_9MICO|nr:phage holin family protein [Cryobacterium tepidiphilum]RNE66999.1 phage holin family protein [Cryobacterium tepidiphilum]